MDARQSTAQKREQCQSSPGGLSCQRDNSTAPFQNQASELQA